MDAETGRLALSLPEATRMHWNNTKSPQVYSFIHPFVLRFSLSLTTAWRRSGGWECGSGGSRVP